jgi:hypothetical protein
MNEQHLNYLLQAIHIQQGVVGRSALAFGQQAQAIEELPQALNQRFDRANLLDLIQNQIYSDLAVTVAIFAWGGMRRDHAKQIFDNWNYLSPIVNAIRSEQINTRIDAFDTLMNARREGHLEGLGISFFTKLICFLNPNLHGYILDQWTGKSTNLLYRNSLNDNQLINITANGWISDHNNTTNTYESFCQRIEEVANVLNCTPLEAEERLFSHGGRIRGMWRQYVINSY